MTAEAYLSVAYGYMHITYTVSVYAHWQSLSIMDSHLLHTSHIGLIFFGIFIYLLPLSLKSSGVLYVTISRIILFCTVCMPWRKEAMTLHNSWPGTQDISSHRVYFFKTEIKTRPIFTSPWWVPMYINKKTTYNCFLKKCMICHRRIFFFFSWIQLVLLYGVKSFAYFLQSFVSLFYYEHGQYFMGTGNKLFYSPIDNHRITEC